METQTHRGFKNLGVFVSIPSGQAEREKKQPNGENQRACQKGSI